jgi:hypothetical protein
MRNWGKELCTSNKMPIVTALGVPGLPDTWSCKTAIKGTFLLYFPCLWVHSFEFEQVSIFLTDKNKESKRNYGVEKAQKLSEKYTGEVQ